MMLRHVLFLVFVGVAASNLAPFYKTDVSSRVPNKYIVILEEDTVEQIANKIEVMSNDFDEGPKVLRRWNSVLFGLSVEMSQRAMEKVRTFQGIKYIEEDTLGRGASVASWGLDRVDQRYLPLDDRFVPRGDGFGVNAYVLDTGIRYSHVDYEGRAAFWYDCVQDGQRDPTGDCHGHGTHCAGTLGARNYGVATKVNLWDVRVLNCNNLAMWSWVIDGLNRIGLFGAKPGVASVSIYGSFSLSLNAAVNDLVNKGFPVVICAGNDNADACGYSPASAADGITVGATDKDDARWSSSSWGSCVHIFGPGVNILSTYRNSDTSTAYMSGTSMATPHVAGAAAIHLQLNPGLSAYAVKNAILNDATVNVVSNPRGTPNRMLYIG
ncbi:aqualysin-1-like [Ptychodera flava]|uniref:aqualysin-1-like n=1 Tax=Ptychodera flava TaxID=63121 RepID=UPI00396A768F